MATDRWAVVRFTADHPYDPGWQPTWSYLEEEIDKALDAVGEEYRAGLYLPLKHGVPVILDYDPAAKKGTTP